MPPVEGVKRRMGGGGKGDGGVGWRRTSAKTVLSISRSWAAAAYKQNPTRYYSSAPDERVRFERKHSAPLRSVSFSLALSLSHPQNCHHPHLGIACVLADGGDNDGMRRQQREL